MYIRVTVAPGSKKELIQKLSGNKWTISVKEPAEQNRANERVCTLIARDLGVARSDIRILTGHHSRVKMISVLT